MRGLTPVQTTAALVSGSKCKDGEVSLTRPSGLGVASNCLAGLRLAPQAEPQSNPAGTSDHEIDAEKQPEDVQARDWPPRQDQTAEHERDQAGQQNPHPRRFLLYAEGQDYAHDSRGNQRHTQDERQYRCGQKRILEGDESGDNVENAKQNPEQELSPTLDLKGAYNFGDTRDNHHDADKKDTDHSRREDAAECDQSSDDINDP